MSIWSSFDCHKHKLNHSVMLFCMFCTICVLGMTEWKSVFLIVDIFNVCVSFCVFFLECIYFIWFCRCTVPTPQALIHTHTYIFLPRVFFLFIWLVSTDPDNTTRKIKCKFIFKCLKVVSEIRNGKRIELIKTDTPWSE